MTKDGRICANCGAAVRADGGYCTACGTALGTRLCANGHVMASDWLECRYCSAGPAAESVESAASSESGGEPEASPEAPAAGAGFVGRAALLAEEPPPSPGPSRRRDPVPAPPSESVPAPRAAPRAGRARQQTVYDPGLPDEASAAAPAAGASRLVGWLVTFSLDPAGVDFRLREGRNWIGADPGCDVVIEGHGVSGQHAVIMARNGQLQIRDNDSTNGTCVNDRDLFGQGAVPIDDGDRIRLGKVELTLYLL